MLRLYLVYTSHVLNGLLTPDTISLLPTKYLRVAGPRLTTAVIDIIVALIQEPSSTLQADIWLSPLAEPQKDALLTDRTKQD